MEKMKFRFNELNNQQGLTSDNYLSIIFPRRISGVDITFG
jgi:hypothetical protein